MAGGRRWRKQGYRLITSSDETVAQADSVSPWSREGL